MQGCLGSLAVKGMREHQVQLLLLNNPVLKAVSFEQERFVFFWFLMIMKNSPTICQLMAALTEPGVIQHKGKLMYCMCGNIQMPFIRIVLTLGLHRYKENSSVFYFTAENKKQAPSCSIQLLED